MFPQRMRTASSFWREQSMSENRPQMTVQSAVEVVAAVVDVEQGEKVLRIYREEQAPVDFVCMAYSEKPMQRSG